MSETDRLPASFTRTILPWILAGAALLLYLGTLNSWLTLSGLEVASRVFDWQWWTLNQKAPVYYLVTRPVLWLPMASQITALNVLAAFCCAGAVGLLARTAAILPQDRTIYQRSRMRSPHGVLTIATNWLPPVLACSLLALQLTFWENATSASQEALNILLFAYVVRCLFEYRISGRDSWLYRMAFVAGLAATNNSAMFGFAPILFAGVFWVKGRSLFRRRFLLVATACLLAGLTPYFVLPAIEAGSGKVDASFWKLLYFQIAGQKVELLGIPKYVALMLAIGSVFPAVSMCIRWPTHLGEASALGAMVTHLLFQVVHILFLALPVWFFFDYFYSPRVQYPESSFLTLYYLCALCAAYYCGYFLLVGMVKPEPRRKASSMVALARGSAALIAWGALLAVPVVAWRNWPDMQLNKNGPTARFAKHLASRLPEKPAILLADRPEYLLLVAAYHHQQGRSCPHALVFTRLLEGTGYHRLLASRYPGLWTDRFASAGRSQLVSDLALIGLISAQTAESDVIYLHPSFGSYFEALYPRLDGMLLHLRPYQLGMIGPPPLSADAVQANDAFWSQVPPPPVSMAEADASSDAASIGRLYSRAANHWGVWQQRAGRYDSAKRALELALAYFPSNGAARFNLEVNAALSAQSPMPVIQDASSPLGNLKNWAGALNEFGPYDHPDICFFLGRVFTAGGLPRQAVEEFIRARALAPDNAVYYLAEAEMYLKGRMPAKALSALETVKTRGLMHTLSLTNQLIGVQLEATAYLAATNAPAAIKVIQAAMSQNGEHPLLLRSLVAAYSAAGRYADALAAMETMIKQAPKDLTLQIQKAVLQFQSGDSNGALTTLDGVLEGDTQNTAALELRGRIHLQLRNLEAAKADFLSLQKMAPGSLMPDFGLGEIAYLQGNKEEAIAHLEKFLKVAPPGAQESVTARRHLDEMKGGQR